MEENGGKNTELKMDCVFAFCMRPMIFITFITVRKSAKSSRQKLPNLTVSASLIAQSFSPNSAQDGQQVCRPAQTRVTKLSASCEFQCDQNARRK
jgi:hypothetical protein